MAALHIDLVCRTRGPGAVDGIRDHGVMLAKALSDLHGVTASIHDLRLAQAGRDLVGLTADEAAGEHAVVVQYNAFSYGRRGCAPWLVRELRRLRSERPATVIVLLAHELFVEMRGPRDTILGLLQRAQFAALRAVSDVVLVTTEPFARRAGGIGRKPAVVLPVGSNLPAPRLDRADARCALAIETDQVVVGLFGTDHWSRMFDLLALTVDHLADGRRLVVLNLGAGAPPLHPAGDDVVVHTPGELDATALGDHLSAVDLLLLPFVDGISTRRTTLMAGLQHGVPVLSTDGPSTGALLRSSSGVDLVQLDEVREAFPGRAATLLDDARLRKDLARAGGELYEAHFAWPVIAGRLLRCIGGLSSV